MRMRMRILKDDHGYDAYGFLGVGWTGPVASAGWYSSSLPLLPQIFFVSEHNLFTIKLGA